MRITSFGRKRRISYPSSLTVRYNNNNKLHIIFNFGLSFVGQALSQIIMITEERIYIKPPFI